MRSEYKANINFGLLRREEVLEIVAIGKTQLYKMMAMGEFPRSVRIGPNLVRWRIQEVREWIDGKCQM